MEIPKNKIQNDKNNEKGDDDLTKRRTIFSWLGFVIYGFAGGGALIIFSELIKFSYINLIPFGAPSWAVWFYPAAFILSFSLFGKVFKIKNMKIIILVIAIVFTFGFYMILGENLFHNPIPFGINAVPD